jgi:type II secretory pathway component PulF
MSTSLAYIEANIAASRILISSEEVGLSLFDAYDIIEDELSDQSICFLFREMFLFVCENQSKLPINWHPECFSQSSKMLFYLGFVSGSLKMSLEPNIEILKAHKAFRSKPGALNDYLPDFFAFTLFNLINCGVGLSVAVELVKLELGNEKYSLLIDQMLASSRQVGAMAPVLFQNELIIPTGMAEGFDKFESKGEIIYLEEALISSQSSFMNFLAKNNPHKKSDEQGHFYQLLAKRLGEGLTLDRAIPMALTSCSDEAFQENWNHILKGLNNGSDLIPLIKNSSLSLKQRSFLVSGLQTGLLINNLESLYRLSSYS